MIAICREWNDQPLDGILIEINEEDEISLAWLISNFKEAPLLNSLSDLPFRIQIIINVFLLARTNLRSIRNYWRCKMAKSHYVHGLTSLKGERLNGRLPVTMMGGQQDN